ncbi:MAG: hypothetical protein ACOYZ7_19320 [Chloroflexota bacterium]
MTGQQRTMSVIVIHGVGDQPYAYHDPLAERVKAEFQVLSGMSIQQVDEAIRFRPVDWSDIGRQEQESLLKRFYPTPSRRQTLTDLYPLRQMLVTGFDDALLYLSSHWHDRIKNLLRQAIVAEGQWLRERYPEGPLFVNIVAHSLGCIITYDVCYDFYVEVQHYLHVAQTQPDALPPVLALDLELSNLFTMGSPLAIWSLTHDPAQTWYRDRPVAVRQGGAWLNFYSRWDPLAFPLAPIYPALIQEGVLQDVAVWSGANAHSGYWSCRPVAQRIAERLWIDFRTFAGKS